MGKKSSSGIGHNGDLPSQGAFRVALATEIIFDEHKKVLRERHKRARKGYEKNGIVLSDVDFLFKHKDDTEAEIENLFRRMWNAAGSHFGALAQQFDLFTQKATGERKAAFKHKGLMAGLKLEDNTPPGNLLPDEQNEWLEGYNEGRDARDEGDREFLATMAEALDNAAAGKVTDGRTGKAIEPDAPKAPKPSAAAAKTAKKAASDFAKDNPWVEQPDWTAFSSMPAEWATEQSVTFRKWFDSIPKGSTVQITHPGVRAAAEALATKAEVSVSEKTNVITADFAESTPEELAQQQGRDAAAAAAETKLSQSDKAKAALADAGLDKP